MIKTKVSPTKALLALGLISAFCAGLVASPTFAEDPSSGGMVGGPGVDKFIQCIVDSYNYENSTELTTLTAEQKASLKTLYCYDDSNITLVESSGLTSLETLSLSGVDNESIDLSSNTNLKTVEIYGAPKLTSVTFPSNPNIEELSLDDTAMTNLNLSSFSKLKRLVIDASVVNLPESNSLNSIFITGASNLDVSKNPNLVYLFISGGDINSLDLSQNAELDTLTITGTKISEIDLSHNPKLTIFELLDNTFSKLDMSKNDKLIDIRIEKSGLSKIDTSVFPNLEYLMLSENNLEELDVSKNPKLKSLDISKNKIKSVNFGDNKAELYYLNARNTELVYVDLSQADEDQLWAHLSDNKSLKIVAVPKSWEGKYTEDQIRERLGLDENQKDVIIQFGPLKAPNTGFGISEMAQYGAIVVLPTILLFAGIAKNAAKAKSKRVRFSR